MFYSASRGSKRADDCHQDDFQSSSASMADTAVFENEIDTCGYQKLMLEPDIQQRLSLMCDHNRIHHHVISEQIQCQIKFLPKHCEK